ncbi:MAG: hypothetical protein AAFY10_02310 [Pseudomonadota bacterium]
MRPFVLFLIPFTILAGCEQHRPSEANCFSFVARGPVEKNCDFEPLDGADLSSGWLE